MKKLFKSNPKHPSPAASVNTHDEQSDPHPRSISPFVAVPPADADPLPSPPLDAAYESHGDRHSHQYTLQQLQQQQVVPRERREPRDHRDRAYRNSKVNFPPLDDNWEIVTSPNHNQLQQQQQQQQLQYRERKSSLTAFPNPHSPPISTQFSASPNILPPGASPPIPAPPVTTSSTVSPYGASPTSPVPPQPATAPHLANTNPSSPHYNVLRKRNLPSQVSSKDTSQSVTGTAAILRALDSSMIGLGPVAGLQQQKVPPSFPSAPPATKSRESHSLSGDSENTRRQRPHSLSLSDIEFEGIESDRDSLEQERERAWRDRDREIDDAGGLRVTGKRDRERGKSGRDREMNVSEKEKSTSLRKVWPEESTPHASKLAERGHEREGKGIFDRLQLQSEGDGRRKREGSRERREQNVSKDRGKETKEDRKLQWNALFSNAKEKDKGGIKGRLKEFETSENHTDPLARMVGLFVSPSFEAIDWTLAYELCERTSVSESDAKSIAKYLRKELKYARPAEQLGAATLWAIMLQSATDTFVTQTSSRKFLEVVEDNISNPRAGAVRDRLLEVLSAAVYISAEKAGKDASKRESFRSLWRKVKPEGYPDEGMPLSPDNAMFRSKSAALHLNKYSNAAVDVDNRRMRSPTIDRRSSKNGVIPVEEDMRRLLQECKVGRGNAAVLNEALAFATPNDLKEKDIIKEFYAKCRSSQELIYAQIPWASAGAEHSRLSQLTAGDPRLNVIPGMPPTREEKLLAELLGANEELAEALRIYDEIEHIGLEIERSTKDLNRVTLEPRPDRSEIQTSNETPSLLHTPSIAPSSSRSTSPASMFVASQTSQVSLLPHYDVQNTEHMTSVFPQHSAQPVLTSVSNSSHGHLVSGNLPPPSRPLHGPRSPVGVASLHSRSSSPAQVSRPSSRSHSHNSSVDAGSDALQAPVELVVPVHDPISSIEIDDGILPTSAAIGTAAIQLSDKAVGKRKMMDMDPDIQDVHDDYNSEELSHLENSDSRRPGYETDEASFNETLRPDRWKVEVCYVYDAAAERTKERIKEGMARNVVS